MKISMLGTRGSIPTPSGMTLDGEKFMTMEFGGNTTCYMIEAGEKKHIIDAGTGIRPLGNYLLKKRTAKDINLYLTHTHWDHIQGFPFFGPAYVEQCNVNMYGEAKVKGDLVEAIRKSDPQDIKDMLSIMSVEGTGIKQVLTDQQKFRNFPAPLAIMKGLGKFYDFIPGGKIYEDNALTVETTTVNHLGGCVSYKFTERKTGKTIVVATDFEPDNNGLDDKLVDWWDRANIVVADGQYEQGSKTNPFVKTWGHSDYKTDIDLAKQAGVDKLVLTHHEPKMDDTYHLGLEKRAKEYASENLEVVLAREGATYEV